MSQTREELKSQSQLTLSAFIATFATQPVRVMLSRAQKDFWPWMTFINGWRSIGNGLPINLIRGTASTASAAYAKQHTGEYVKGSHPWVATSAMLTASSAAEMSVAYMFETCFIRKSNLDNKNMLNGIKFSPFKFTPILAPLYFIRGVGFGAIVFYSNDLPNIQQNAVLLAGTAFTATAQKFISAVATGDIMRHEGTVPDFKEGVIKTLRNVARGDVYTHNSYKGYYQNPASLSKQLVNFAYVGCNPSIFFWRLSYLYGVKYVYNKAEKNSSSILSKHGLFADFSCSLMSRLMTDSELEVMKESDQYSKPMDGNRSNACSMKA